MEWILEPPIWFWFALAVGLLIAELSTGTLWLLWPAASAGLVGLAANAPLAPKGPGAWLLFAGLTLVLAAAARSMGIKHKDQKPDERAFNTTDNFVGKPVKALAAFDNGLGRVRLGDTDWSARSAFQEPVTEGQQLIVEGVDGNVLLVGLVPSD